MEIVSESLEQTKTIAQDFAKGLKTRRKTTVVALYGDLGSGKTTFVQFIARALGVEEAVQSPTFVIIKRYKLKDKKHKYLFHIDAYRLKAGKELDNLGWQEICASSENIVLVEWPENVKEVVPKDVIEIKFEFVDENTRRIIFYGTD